MYKNISCNFPTYIPQYLISNRDKLEVVSENVKITNTAKINFIVDKNTANKYMNIEKYISKSETIIATLFCNNKIFIFIVRCTNKRCSVKGAALKILTFMCRVGRHPATPPYF